MTARQLPSFVESCGAVRPFPRLRACAGRGNTGVDADLSGRAGAGQGLGTIWCLFFWQLPVKFFGISRFCKSAAPPLKPIVRVDAELQVSARSCAGTVVGIFGI
jgi:hypothetical protein